MIFQPSKGIISLDIDGTITVDTHSIHAEVVKCLHHLQKEGWRLIFITGRPFQWAIEVTQHLPFPYVLAVQNGALILEMPTQSVLDRKYLDSSYLPIMEAICQKEHQEFIIYAGWEQQDRCYYRPERLDPSMREYLQKRSNHLGEPWIAVSHFDHLPISTFASFKFFSRSKQQAFLLSEQIEKQAGLHAPVNRDPFNESYFIVQVTNPQATKGEVLRFFNAAISNQGPVIAAGDDNNDWTMLQQANIKVVMEQAPESLKAIADIIAPPVTENGIIIGLTQAVNRIS